MTNEVDAYQQPAMRSTAAEELFCNPRGSVVEGDHTQSAGVEGITVTYDGYLVTSLITLKPSDPYTPFHEPVVVVSVRTNDAVAGVVVVFAAASKKIPLTTALTGLVLVTRIVTRPLRFHTRYWPPPKLATFLVSSTLLFVSRISIF